MKTRFFTKKLFFLYTALILASAALLVSTFVSKGSSVDAARGWITHMPLHACTNDECVCPTWAEGGCDVDVHICDEPYQDGPAYCTRFAFRYQDRTIDPGEAVSLEQILNGINCAYIQIDINRPDDPTPTAYYGAVALEWDDWSECVEGCPYNSSHVKFRYPHDDQWTNTIELGSCPQEIFVAGFHNNSNQFATDTRIRIVSDNYDQILSNNQSFIANKGEYEVRLRTRISETDLWYPEAECRADYTIVCPADIDNPGIEITKTAQDDDEPYQIGDIVNFEVRIENVGDTTIDTISYRDVFDRRYLRFVRVIATSNQNPQGIDMTNMFNLRNEGYMTIMSHDDLTQVLGDLGIGDSYTLNYDFIAVNPSARACNDVFASADGLPEEQARDCVGIIIPTDK